jgi:signal transduction histidine kinase
MTDDLTSPADRSSDHGGSSEFYRELDTQLLVHDLKSPLSLIEATTRTLLEHTRRLGPLTPRQERALRRILRGAVRGQQVVNHLLEIGRAESEQFADAWFDPAEVVLQVLLESAESSDGDLAMLIGEQSDDHEKVGALAEAGIYLSLEPGIADLRIFQDRVKFELIVGNLIQNALRYRRQFLDVLLQEAGDDLAVTVKDDGPGIAPEHQAVVFERYKRAPADSGLERKGHGLGLAGARILARRLGGEISLESEAGRGATFRLTIPRDRSQAAGDRATRGLA